MGHHVVEREMDNGNGMTQFWLNRKQTRYLTGVFKTQQNIHAFALKQPPITDTAHKWNCCSPVFNTTEALFLRQNSDRNMTLE